MKNVNVIQKRDILIDIRHGEKDGQFLTDSAKVHFFNLGKQWRNDFPDHEMVVVPSNYGRTHESMVWLMKGAGLVYNNYSLVPSMAGFTDDVKPLYKSLMKTYPKMNEFRLCMVEKEIADQFARWVLSFAEHFDYLHDEILLQRDMNELPQKPLLIVRINHSPNVDGLAYLASGCDGRLIVGAKPGDYVRYILNEDGSHLVEASYVEGFSFIAKGSMTSLVIENLPTVHENAVVEVD
jgi:hypothetical protein